MKKFHSLVLLAGICIGVSGIISSLPAAEIIYVEGSVQVQGAQGDSWVKAEKGMPVNIGDKIRTARHSRADVALNDEKTNTIRIEPKTLIVLNSANPGLIDKLDLSHGKVYSKVENIKSGLAFEVTTPSAIAGVRGSAFSVYAEKDSDEIQALKDSAFVQAFDADGKLIMELTVPEGFKTFVDRFEGPSSLIEVSLREFSRFDNIADDITAHEQGKMEVRREREKAAAAEPKKPAEGLADAQQQSQVIDQLEDIKQQEKENELDKIIPDTRHQDSGWVW